MLLNIELQKLLDRQLLWKAGKALPDQPLARAAPSEHPAIQTREATSEDTVKVGQEVGAKASTNFLADFGVESIDHALGGGLQFGEIHEWVLDAQLPRKYQRDWVPPLLVPLSVVARLNRQVKMPIVWVGRKCWANPEFLSATNLGHSQSIFLDVTAKDDRVWAAIQALKSRYARIVICDASGFKCLELRKLHFAARGEKVAAVSLNGGCNTGPLCLVFRSPQEAHIAANSATSWRLTSVVGDTTTNTTINSTTNHGPTWQLELTRGRGMSPKSWLVSWNGENLVEVGEMRASEQIAIK